MTQQALTQTTIRRGPALVVALALQVLAGCSASSEAQEKTFVTSGFRPDVDGFSFANYNNNGVTNLSPNEMREMLGEAACRNKNPRTECVLRPVYASLMRQLNEGMNGGHCEGMAALAGLIYQGKRSPTEFGTSTTTFGLRLEDNQKLQRSIATYFAYQILDPTRDTRVQTFSRGPTALLKELEDSFARGKGAEMYTLALYRPGLKGGHSITPYAIARGANGEAAILVYDNNFPGVSREVMIDTNKDTWRYVASVNPNQPSALYEGDKATGTLGITRNNARLEPQRCTLCERPALAKNEAIGERRFYVAGDAHLLIEDQQRQKLGYQGAEYIDTMADGEGFPIFGQGFELAERSVEPIYAVNSPGTLNVTLDGTELRNDTKPSVTLIAAGTALELREDSLQPGEKSALQFDGTGKQLRYVPDHRARATLLLGFQYADEDWLIEVTGDFDASGGLELSVDRTTGKVRFASLGAERQLTLRLTKQTGAGEARAFDQKNVTVGAKEAIELGLGAWLDNGSPIAIGRDFDSDGQVDVEGQLLDDIL
jgi:hypothetical protein